MVTTPQKEHKRNPTGGCQASHLEPPPADAVDDVRRRVAWVSRYPGGRGAVRELVEMDRVFAVMILIGVLGYAIDQGLFRRLEVAVASRWDVAPR